LAPAAPRYARGVTPRTRVFLLVGLAAALASGAVVAGVLATRSSVPSVKPLKGLPPLALDFGVRTDPEARALRRALRLYDARPSQTQQAAEIFRRYDSLEAEIGAAFASWPAGTLARLRTLAASHPHSSLAALHLGIALYWSRRDAEAQAAWRAAKRLQPDTFYAVRAGDFLHPRPPIPGLPTFVPSFGPPKSLASLSPPDQVAALRRAAAHGGAHAKILYGVALQKLYRPVSAERQFVAAAGEAPNDPEARAAEAVGLFDKANPALAFSRLGPLVRVFPRAQTVRFHLGLLLLWTGRLAQAKIELRRAVQDGPHTALGQQAAQLLSTLQRAGTG
jgi:tetratricopeptide (TPR) repeat protein